MGNNIKEWLKKKSSELLGDAEEMSFVDHILAFLRYILMLLSLNHYEISFYVIYGLCLRI